MFVAILALMAGNAAARGRSHAATRLEQVSGVVTQASAQWLTIRTSHGDRVLQLNELTAMRAGDRPAPLSSIRIGDKVKVQVRHESSGMDVATAIELDDEISSEIDGIVRLVSATSITVTTRDGDITVTLTPSTRVLIDGHPASASLIAVGSRAEIDATRDAGGSYTALLVKVESEVVEIEGTISAVSPDSLTIRRRDGSEITVSMTADTVVRQDDHLISAASLKPGMRVEVKALKNADQSLTALVIRAEAADAFAEITGDVTSVGTDSIHVRTRSGDEVTVMITPDTMIRIGDHLVSLANVHVGDRVEIQARLGAGGTLIAVRIEIDDDAGAEHVEIDGVIVSIAGSTLTIRTEDGHEVVVTIGSGTAIRRGNQVLSISDLKAGDKVEIRAERNPDGSLQALEIKVEGAEDEHDTTVEIEGTVTAVSGGSLTVHTRENGTLTVTITSDTVVRKGDHPGSVSDIAVGRQVEIKATRKSDGTLVATVIKVNEGDD